MVKNIYSLTPLQEGMLFHSLYREDKTPYFEQIILDINGVFDVEIFQESWNKIIERYDVFKTIFVHKNTPTPKQVVLKKSKIDFFYKDIRLDKSFSIDKFITDNREKYFELSKKPPLRVSLFQIEDNYYKVIIVFHHIVMDGWSGGIVFSELFKIYDSIKNQNGLNLTPVKPYNLYVKWLKNQDKLKTKTFWREYLKDYNKEVIIPKKSDTKEYKLQKRNFIIKEETTKKLESFIQDNSLTLNVLIQSLWGILLAKLNNSRDVVFGATVSGRVDKIDGIEKMVGLFINAIPIRVKFTNKTLLIELLKEMMKESIEAKEHHYYSLADIQSDTPLKDKLINQLLVFENYPEIKSDKDDSEYEVESVDVFNQTNYNFDMTIFPSDSIEIMFKYNALVYSEEIISTIQNGFLELIDIFINNPKIKVDEISLNNFPKIKETKSYDIFISSTFTVEPIEDGLLTWAKKFDTTLNLSFSAYNQVMQDLINQNSPLYRESGLNILLIRFEDVLRFMNLKTKDEKIKAIEDNYQNTVSILENSNFSIPTFITLFKPKDDELSEYLKELYEKFSKKLENRKNIYLIDFRNLDSIYQVNQIFDQKSDKIGHVPFSDEYFFAMGSFLFRKIYAYYNPHFKVIALDCDNTLWGGVVGEDGVEGIDITGGFLELQKFAIKKQKEGFLIVLNSKNNENDVWEVFEKNEKMLLKKEHITHSKINWQPKSQNLQEMAKELNLGVNSFIFLDDNPLECSEIIKNLPDVLSIPLPKNQASFKLFLEHIWAVDKLKVTDEDKKRTQMYKAETKRNQNSQKLSMDDFLSSLELKIYMNKMFDSQLSRVSQLTQRTNQFNVSTIRRSESDIKKLLSDENFVCWSVNVEDKFGDYGLVAVIISQKKEKVLFIDTFLMSCRVLGRGVEKSILSGLKTYAKANNLTKLEMDFYPTKKNRPALDFIENYSFKLDKEYEDKKTYSLIVEEMPEKSSFVEFYFDRDEAFFENKRLKEKVIPEQNSIQKESKEIPEIVDDFEFGFLESIEESQIEKLPHKKFYEPLKFHKASDNISLIEKDNDRKVKVEFIAPTTEEEIKLANIYKELLNLHEVGVKDCFFELGGHSLTATRLLSRIHQNFQVELELKDIFSNPTIDKLLKVIKTKNTKEFFEIKPIQKSDSYALSNAQRRLWVLDKMQDGMNAYNMFGAIVFKQAIDSSVLNQAIKLLIDRHEILRTNFKEINGEIRQIIHEKSNFTLDTLEINDTHIDTYLLNEAKSIFNLEEDSLINIKLINKNILFINMHHIISDGWSINVIIQELSTIYNALLNKKTVELPKLTLQYKDYTYWQNSILEDDEYLNKHKNYWHKLLSEYKRLEFPTDFPRLHKKSFEGDYLTHQFDKKLTHKIKEISKDNTLFITLLTITNILLSRYSNSEDILIGSVVANRLHQSLFNQIGFYVNTLALRNHLEQNKTFKENLLKIKENTLETYKHQSYPFDKLVDEFDLERDISQNPLFNIMIILQNNEQSELNFGNIDVQFKELNTHISKFDMTFNFTEASEDSLHLYLEYNTTLFKESTIKRVIANLETLIEAIEPNKRLNDLNLISKDELALLDSFNQTDKEYPRNKTIIELFEKQVAKSPNNIAVVYKDKNLTYQELNNMTNILGEYLRKEYSIKADSVVPIMADRGEWMIIAILGILKAGGAYLPVDPEYPKERIEFMLSNSHVNLLISHESNIHNAREYAKDLNIKTLNIEDLDYTREIKNLEIITNANDLIYVMYTSGSTGKPKGVMVENRGVVNTILYNMKLFNIHEKSRFLQYASFSFDASVDQIFVTLLSGATLITASKNDIVNNFNNLIKEKEVTVIQTTPSFLNSIEIGENLETIVTGGEPAIVEDAIYYAKKSNYINVYGLTETSIDSTSYIVDSNKEYKRVPIGKAINNTKLYILNSNNALAPLGAIGELCIAGDGVARGYLNDKTLTQKRFITHPIYGRIYKTGDKAKYLEDGNIEYLGREDEQIKIRGFRVELGEIKNTLLNNQLIKEASVIAKKLSDDETNSVLIAYIVYEQSHTNENSIEEIKSYLKNRLPIYMIPNFFVELKKLPLTTNGKIDKKSLPNPTKIKRDTLLNTPKTKTQEEVAKIFMQVLKIDNISIDDNFFNIGGYSLNAIKTISLINKFFNKNINISEIFKHPTIKELSNIIDFADIDNKDKLPYKIYNKDKSKSIFIFPSILHIADDIFIGELSHELNEYKIYIFEFLDTKNRVEKYAKLINELENEYSLLGYSTGGILAFEVAKKLGQIAKNKPRNLILFDSWKIDTLDTIDKKEREKFLSLLKEYGLESYNSQIESYINMLNEHQTLGYIDTPINLIQAKHEDIQIKTHSQNWDLNTSEFKLFQGFGNHDEMIKGKYLKRNSSIIKNSIS